MKREIETKFWIGDWVYTKFGKQAQMVDRVSFVEFEAGEVVLLYNDYFPEEDCFSTAEEAQSNRNKEREE